MLPPASVCECCIFQKNHVERCVSLTIKWWDYRFTLEIAYIRQEKILILSNNVEYVILWQFSKFEVLCFILLNFMYMVWYVIKVWYHIRKEGYLFPCLASFYFTSVQHSLYYHHHQALIPVNWGRLQESYFSIQSDTEQSYQLIKCIKVVSNHFCPSFLMSL